jgi:hypothetical protein
MVKEAGGAGWMRAEQKQRDWIAVVMAGHGSIVDGEMSSNERRDRAW